MAEFCRQCAEELFGAGDNNDMKGRVTEEQFKQDIVSVGLCEGCSGGEFDHEGNCCGNCLEESHNK